jgi:hypothetical protein
VCSLSYSIVMQAASIVLAQCGATMRAEHIPSRRSVKRKELNDIFESSDEKNVRLGQRRYLAKVPENDA